MELHYKVHILLLHLPADICETKSRIIQVSELTNGMKYFPFAARAQTKPSNETTPSYRYSPLKLL